MTTNISPAALSVIIPAHNEEHRIASTLCELREALPGCEMIVVVNNSSDRTADVVRETALKDAAIRLIDIPAQVGKGGAVRIGFRLATRPNVAFVDADGATSGHEIKRLLSYLEDSECVVGSRWLPGAKIDVRQSFARRFLSRGFNACVRAMFGMRISDTQCGAKVFRRATLERILDEIETADFAFDVDLLYAMHRRGLSVREVPTIWCERPGSKVNVWAAVPRMFLSLMRLRLQHSFLRLLLPLFDRSFRLTPIRSRRALRYLVLAAGDGRDAAHSDLERDVRLLLDEIESPAREIVWFSVDSMRLAAWSPRWLTSMIAYLRRFRDEFDCVIEVVPDAHALLTPLYCLKPKVVITRSTADLPSVYTSALVLDGRPTKRGLEEALLLAMTRIGTHIYVDRDGHLVLGEITSSRAVRELLIARAEPSSSSR